MVRHDAVAWGHARGADQNGVDIIQNCEVTGFQIEMAFAQASKPQRVPYLETNSGHAVGSSLAM